MTLAWVVALSLAGPLPDPETSNPFLIQAKELYEALDFEKCMQRIKQSSSWKNPTSRDLRDVELYGALCALNLGQKAEAAERFKLALRIDEDLELPEFASPKAVKLFLYVKRKLRQPSVAPMPDEDLPADAPTPAKLEAKTAAEKEPGDKPVVVRSPSPLSRYVPPIVLGVGALAFGSAAIGLGVNSKSLETHAKAQRAAMAFESEYLATRGQAQANAIAANVAFGIAGALAVAALVVLIMQQ